MILKSSVSIQVIGSINMDLIAKVSRFPKEGETITGQQFLTAAGGKGANQAVAASRLGAKVSLVGCVGKDTFGTSLLNNLKKEKINIKHITKSSENTGTAFITINQNAQNQIIVIPGANHTITTKQVGLAIKKEKIAAIIMQLEIPLKIVEYVAKEAKKKNLLVILNPAPAIPLSNKLLRMVDYLIPNEHEAEVLTGEKNMEKAAQILKQKGAKNIIITLGSRGALYLDNKLQYVPPFRVKAVDPTAAGDAFVAAFTVSILEGKKIENAIRFANAAGALAATKLGAQPSLPKRSQVEKITLNTL